MAHNHHNMPHMDVVRSVPDGDPLYGNWKLKVRMIEHKYIEITIIFIPVIFFSISTIIL